jgi:hypothetical protein
VLLLASADPESREAARAYAASRLGRKGE